MSKSEDQGLTRSVRERLCQTKCTHRDSVERAVVSPLSCAVMEEFDDLLKEPDESGYLDLSHRAWATLDDVLWTWGQQLIVLNVAFNNVKSISVGIGELVLLREFDMSCNSLEALPDEIGHCTRLKKIRLNGNRLKELPESIGNCKMLEELIISENALELLPKSIGSVPTLRVLKAANNHLREVEPTICQCLALEDIDVQGNDTANVPNELRANTKMIIWLCRRDRDQRQLGKCICIFLPL